MSTHEWDRHSILATLRRQGMTLAGLAAHYDISRNSVRNIWTRPNEKVERAIADFIGEPVERLFPRRYPKRRPHILKPEFASSRGNPSSSSQKDAA
ncbi:helix-turn-helix domain-containing protein [Nitratireductor soli]|uniref:helix-turn-helix domain-containing protein n=1 Tax=Nitratireductor soli TaxID=1670619 RepID=UPI00065DF053|nr:helix-turn-helix domain-containing protein [Nitratireductor soli]